MPKSYLEILDELDNPNKITLSSQERRKKIRENAKINPNYGMKGKHHTEKTKRKIGLANYKGENAGADAKHSQIKKLKPKPEFCEDCHKKEKLALANIRNHNYTLNPKDYKWLCWKCHRELHKLMKANKKRFLLGSPSQ
jgi:hypothetical protein